MFLQKNGQATETNNRFENPLLLSEQNHAPTHSSKLEGHAETDQLSKSIGKQSPSILKKEKGEKLNKSHNSLFSRSKSPVSDLDEANKLSPKAARKSSKQPEIRADSEEEKSPSQSPNPMRRSGILKLFSSGKYPLKSGSTDNLDISSRSEDHSQDIKNSSKMNNSIPRKNNSHGDLVSILEPLREIEYAIGNGDSKMLKKCLEKDPKIRDKRLPESGDLAIHLFFRNYDKYSSITAETIQDLIDLMYPKKGLEAKNKSDEMVIDVILENNLFPLLKYFSERKNEIFTESVSEAIRNFHINSQSVLAVAEIRAKEKGKARVLFESAGILTAGAACGFLATYRSTGLANSTTGEDTATINNKSLDFISSYFTLIAGTFGGAIGMWKLYGPVIETCSSIKNRIVGIFQKNPASENFNDNTIENLPNNSIDTDAKNSLLAPASHEDILPEILAKINNESLSHSTNTQQEISKIDEPQSDTQPQNPFKTVLKKIVSIGAFTNRLHKERDLDLESQDQNIRNDNSENSPKLEVSYNALSGSQDLTPRTIMNFANPVPSTSRTSMGI